MGTTITAALVEPDGRVIFGHVGDSRAYLLRDDKLEQLTNDHTLVAELVRRGELSPGEAQVHPQRSVITRALGTDPDVDVDTFAVDAQPGDIYLICSDGLSSMVDSRDIETILRKNRADLEERVESADPGGEPRRRRRQHHGGALRRGRGRAEPSPVGEPDEQTREFAQAPEEEDTLHPEDGIAPPPTCTGQRSTRWSSRHPRFRRRLTRSAVEGTGRKLGRQGSVSDFWPCWSSSRSWP